MSSPVLPIDPVAAAAPVTARQVRVDVPAAPDPEIAKREATPQDRNGVVVFGGRTVQFAYDDKTGRLVVKVLSDGGEPRQVVRQIPPEDYLVFVARFREMLGILFDHKG